jgi:hypothetical protein
MRAPLDDSTWPPANLVPTGTPAILVSLYVPMVSGLGEPEDESEANMKAWKWIALTATGGTLLALESCVVDLAYYLLQAAASQLVTGALTGATTAA